MMDVSWTYCGNPFTINVTQTIMLFALNLHSEDCQLFLNKTGGCGGGGETQITTEKSNNKNSFFQ